MNKQHHTLLSTLFIVGYELLHVKTSSGETALDIASNNPKMLQFLTTQIKPKHLGTGFSNKLPRATYKKILQGQSIPMQECEKYLFYVLQMVQCYIQEYLIPKKISSKWLCMHCNSDIQILENFFNHIVNLEEHVKNLANTTTLSRQCQLYINATKICILSI